MHSPHSLSQSPAGQSCPFYRATNRLRDKSHTGSRRRSHIPVRVSVPKAQAHGYHLVSHLLPNPYRDFFCVIKEGPLVMHPEFVQEVKGSQEGQRDPCSGGRRHLAWRTLSRVKSPGVRIRKAKVTSMAGPTMDSV